MQYQNMRNAHNNQEKAIFDGVGPYGVPGIPPCNISLDGLKFERFDIALRDRNPKDKIVHFFTDDFLFDRVWHNPEKYLSMLGRFRAVVAPDFSLYADHPKALQIYNHFRKHWCSAYWASMGITVIPSPRWVEGDDSSFEWCLDGDPIGSTICISTHGSIKGDRRKKLFLEGFQATVEKLRPSGIILYGDPVPGLSFDGPLVQLTNENMVYRRKYCRRTREVI